MNPFTYSVSLRVRHPTADLLKLGSELALEPRHSWTAGEPRRTPKGAALRGNRAESEWSAPLLRDGKVHSEEQSLDDALAGIVERLSVHRQTFLRIRAEGGDVELFLGIFGNGNLGIILEPELLSRVGALGVTLSFDIYP